MRAHCDFTSILLLENLRFHSFIGHLGLPFFALFFHILCCFVYELSFYFQSVSTFCVLNNMSSALQTTFCRYLIS